MRDRDRPATWGKNGPATSSERKSGLAFRGRCLPAVLVARGRGGERGKRAQDIAARGAPRGCLRLSRTRPLGAPRGPGPVRWQRMPNEGIARKGTLDLGTFRLDIRSSLYLYQPKSGAVMA